MLPAALRGLRRLPPPARARPPPLRAAASSAAAPDAEIAEALAARAALRRATPAVRLRAAGVTFDARQAAVAALRPGDKLACAREPDNPHDPNAVAISTLDGTPLGYVPRASTGAFRHRLVFGEVASAGRAGPEPGGGASGSSGGRAAAAAAGPWGFSFEVQPAVPAVPVLGAPAALRGALSLAPLLEAQPGWAAARDAALAAAGGRCLVTGAPTASVAERWELDDGARALRLLGFAAAHPAVPRVQQMLAEGEDLAGALAALHGWTAADAEAHLACARAEAARRDAEGGWRLDLGALRALGLAPPSGLEG
jgi:hypothetical protein